MAACFAVVGLAFATDGVAVGAVTFSGLALIFTGGAYAEHRALEVLKERARRVDRRL